MLLTLGCTMSPGSPQNYTLDDSSTPAVHQTSERFIFKKGPCVTLTLDFSVFELRPTPDKS